jgi:hypothetical protein
MDKTGTVELESDMRDKEEWCRRIRESGRKLETCQRIS